MTCMREPQDGSLGCYNITLLVKVPTGKPQVVDLRSPWETRDSKWLSYGED